MILVTTVYDKVLLDLCWDSGDTALKEQVETCATIYLVRKHHRRSSSHGVGGKVERVGLNMEKCRSQSYDEQATWLVQKVDVLPEYGKCTPKLTTITA